MLCCALISLTRSIYLLDNIINYNEGDLPNLDFTDCEVSILRVSQGVITSINTDAVARGIAHDAQLLLPLNGSAYALNSLSLLVDVNLGPQIALHLIPAFSLPLNRREEVRLKRKE